MRIRKFNESDQIDISSDRIEEVVSSIVEISTFLNDKNQFIESLLNELNNYKSESKNKNDQIDDSISNLQIIKSNIIDINDKMDSVINNLNDYNQNGRKFLY